ncbi:hypothetical protein BJY52DRAFT_1421729 [Lactarius psammicola]|nr:hypothetical protein BJY52DRAFT_1421729 [Lactarius psammicola]
MPPKPIPPTIPVTHQQITGVLNSTAQAIEKLLSQNPELTEEVQQSITTFLNIPSISSIMGKPPAPTPYNPPGNLLKDAAALPPRPSVVISLSDIDWNEARPLPAQLCESINDALFNAQIDQVCAAAARWTARGNLIVTGSSDTTAQHLQLAIPTIRQHFSKNYLDSQESPPPLSVRPNVKWSKILINSVPTGVSTLFPNAKNPDQCHAALVADNPTYASLNVTQRPSWVHNPNSYTDNAISSLVVAFEDPDGSLARGLLAGKVLYIFGSCATVRKWKQRPPHPKVNHSATPDTNHPSPPHPSPETVPLTPTDLTSLLLLNPNPAPSLAGPTTRSNQGMKGKAGNAGSSQTKTTQAPTRKKR